MIRTREFYQKKLERSQIKPKYQRTIKLFEHISFLFIFSSILLIFDYSNIKQDIEINK
jgi:TRAP-type mannitol/chloroaromatic compound transport system permease small subunit